MPRKTFISYRYSEARTVRDDILKALGPDATYYLGKNFGLSRSHRYVDREH